MARVLALVSASALFGLLAAPSAFGADIGVSTRVTGYGGLAGKVQERINRTPTRGAVAATATKGSLPFTGADLATIAGGGLVLLGFGVVLRRRTRPRTE